VVDQPASGIDLHVDVALVVQVAVGVLPRLDPQAQQPRLHSVTLTAGAHAIGRTIGDVNLEQLAVTVSAVRRRGIRGLAPGPETRFNVGDVVVLLGLPEGLAAAEGRLLKGGRGGR